MPPCGKDRAAPGPTALCRKHLAPETVQGLGFRVWGLGFRVSGLGYQNMGISKVR